DDPAFFHFLLFERLHEHPIAERSYVNCCHKLVLSLLWFLGCAEAPKPFGAIGKWFRLFLLVVVDDFELRIDNVAIRFARALLGAGMTARLRSRLWTGLRPGLC